MTPVTRIVITDSELRAKLADADGQIIFEGPSGDHVRTVETVPFGKLPPGVKSPFSDEEIEEARKQPDGLPLNEVWKRILERFAS
jgi:hypothetical protein